MRTPRASPPSASVRTSRFLRRDSRDFSSSATRSVSDSESSPVRASAAFVSRSASRAARRSSSSATLAVTWNERRASRNAPLRSGESRYGFSFSFSFSFASRAANVSPSFSLVAPSFSFAPISCPSSSSSSRTNASPYVLANAASDARTCAKRSLSRAKSALRISSVTAANTGFADATAPTRCASASNRSLARRCAGLSIVASTETDGENASAANDASERGPPRSDFSFAFSFHLFSGSRRFAKARSGASGHIARGRRQLSASPNSGKYILCSKDTTSAAARTSPDELGLIVAEKTIARAFSATYLDAFVDATSLVKPSKVSAEMTFPSFFVNAVFFLMLLSRRFKSSEVKRRAASAFSARSALRRARAAAARIFSSASSSRARVASASAARRAASARAASSAAAASRRARSAATARCAADTFEGFFCFAAGAGFAFGFGTVESASPSPDGDGAPRVSPSPRAPRAPRAPRPPRPPRPPLPRPPSPAARGGRSPRGAMPHADLMKSPRATRLLFRSKS